jgi:hypothetical protein
MTFRQPPEWAEHEWVWIGFFYGCSHATPDF